jgi:hypothetical protein
MTDGKINSFFLSLFVNYCVADGMTAQVLIYSFAHFICT